MDCIAAISTPAAMGGISVIRLSGADAFKVAAAVFTPLYPVRDIEKMDGYTAAHGIIRDGETEIDDGVLLIFRAPHSFTGENVAEITCHGGIYITKKVLKCCIAAGAQYAAAGEFTKRALLNGKLSLTKVEGIADLINAGSEQAALCANALINGALYRRIEAVSDVIISAASEVAAWIDYPDETTDEEEITLANIISQTEKAQRDLAALLDTYSGGKTVKDGIRAAIVGKPNVGKSTLMNMLLCENRSIVTDIEGTTRDIIEENIEIEGVALRLSDCAGIRDTSDAVEKMGIDMMLERLDTSQLIFAVFDGSRSEDGDDKRLISLIKGKNVIPIINKSDLEPAADKEYIEKELGAPIIISAATGEGREALINAITQRCSLGSLDPLAGFLANERQYECAKTAYGHLTDALSALTSGMTVDAAGTELESALDALYELSGKNAGEEVIAKVFERFCVGK